MNSASSQRPTVDLDDLQLILLLGVCSIVLFGKKEKDKKNNRNKNK